MRTRVLALVVIATLLCLTLGACASEQGDTGGGSSPSGTSDADTLTRDTLPTEVGTTWTMVRTDEPGTPLTLDVEGPWEFTADADWSTNSYEIVDPASVPGLDGFEGYTYISAVRGDDGPDYYYPRQVTDDWVMGLGRITVDGDSVTPEPREPIRFWPLQLEVGEVYEVEDTAEQTTEAEVLARNTAVLPAGTIENAYLVRFRTAKAAGETTEYYYLFAPNVGMTAYFSKLEGSEADGFTSAGTIVLLGSMPVER